MSAFLLLSISCFTSSAKHAEQKQKISVMTFNVENLFDTSHEVGKLDYTFLPLNVKKKSKEAIEYCETLGNPKWKDECKYLDWSEATMKQKMKNLAQTVSQVNDGKGPDILILQEIENLSVLTNWISNYLPKAKYKTIVLLEGKDARGIDTAIASRFEKTSEPILHIIPFREMPGKDSLDTRGILEVTFAIPGQTLTVYSNHFPAPYHKKEYRIQAYQYLQKLMKEKPADTLQIAGGDFNTPGLEDQKFHMLSSYVQPSWIVAHQVGYHGSEGSSYYSKDKTWSFLDMILLSKSLGDHKGWDWNPNSFQIANQYRAQLDDEKTPQSFDPRTGLGVSDHLPLYLEIKKLN